MNVKVKGDLLVSIKVFTTTGDQYLWIFNITSRTFIKTMKISRNNIHAIFSIYEDKLFYTNKVGHGSSIELFNMNLTNPVYVLFNDDPLVIVSANVTTFIPEFPYTLHIGGAQF
jgi:hypothetical protein